ncbi:MAG: hypothetical protein CVT89_02490 [Candidatus Altiarchaeales archaeon HGW-Altiarchaeales-2]|nr:MAG: hypothetical protein CVT89_02490 [Candidatus Altiarchaeales archaeon HGW-Altiarchaeales-2]
MVTFDGVLFPDKGRNRKLYLSFLHTESEVIKAFEDVFPYKESSVMNEIKRRISPSFFENIRTFILEYPYTEKEWREIYNLHYGKTMYENTSPFVFRLHLLTGKINTLDDISQDSYLGYVTIRPLPINFISKIVLKPKKELYNVGPDEQIYMILIDQKIHLGHKEIEISTFPFFAQDSMVTVCAHADILMIANIMHKKYGWEEITVEKLVLGLPPIYPSGRGLPSYDGLTPDQIGSFLQTKQWYSRIKGFRKTDNAKEAENTVLEILKYIDSRIESAIPCILSFQHHVSIICGHTMKDDVKNGYIVFDDSGYHINEYLKKTEDDKNKNLWFATKISLERLKERLKEKIMGESILLLYPEFEREYFPLSSVLRCVLQIQEHISRTYKIQKEEIDHRILIIDSKKLKKELWNKGIHEFDELSIPHYVWYIEFSKKGNPYELLGCILIDASAHKNDSKYSYISYEKNGSRLLFFKQNIPKPNNIISVLSPC